MRAGGNSGYLRSGVGLACRQRDRCDGLSGHCRGSDTTKEQTGFEDDSANRPPYAD